MAYHNFSFEGEDLLRSIGATWFVSYAYHRQIDPSHRAWERVRTAPMRISTFDKATRYHRQWLLEVLKMNPDNLAKNQIGVTPEQTKAMARKLLGIVG